MTISNVIYKHLQQNRRLVIPNLGAFMVKASGEIIFSELLKGDDGVFRTLLTAEGLSEFEIAAVADRFVFEVRHAISGQGYYILGDWGALVRGADGSLSFEKRSAEEIKIEQKSVSKIEEPIEKSEVKEVVKEKVAPQPTPQPAPRPTAKPQPKPTPLKEETKVEPKQKAEVEPQSPRVTPTQRRPMAQQKRGADRFVVLAVIVLVLALAAIGYGYYVSQLAPDADDAQMDALRVEIERPSNN
jgi:hypothetical protein